MERQISNGVKKYLLAIFVLAVLAAPNFVPASAITKDELQQQISFLLAQIKQLEIQLDEMQGFKEPEWCYNFKNNLKIGDSGSDVAALQTALVKEGFSIEGDEASSNFRARFGEATASAVTGFQQKYEKEILAPWGLKYGTGYVGRTTLKKLNELYGCGAIDPILPPIPPTEPIPLPGIPKQPSYDAGPTTIIRGQQNYFYGSVKTPYPNTSVSFYLQRPDGTMKYNNYYVGKTDAKGNFSKKFFKKVLNEGQNGVWISWVSVRGEESKNVYHNVIEKPTPVPIPPTSPPVPSITVLSPNGGGEKGNVFNPGETIQINWSQQKIDKVTIYLMKTSSLTQSTIVSNYPVNINSTTGSYLYTIPAKTPVADTYKIWIIGYQTGVGQANDWSDQPFSIVAASIKNQGSLYISPSSGSIKIGEKMELKAFYQPPMPPCPSGLACYQVMPPPIPVISEWVSSNSNIATVSYKPGDSKTAIVSGVSQGNVEIKAVYKIKESGNILTAVAKISVTSPKPYERISIIGEISNKGIFDPSVEYNKDGSVGYLVYSGLEQPKKDIGNPFPKYIHTHLAKSIDNGKTWRFVKRINESNEDTMANTNSLRSIGLNEQFYQGVWHHEVPTLVYVPDDKGKEWKLFWMKYFSIKNPREIGRIRVPEYLWIMMKEANSPENLDKSEEKALFSTSLAIPKAKFNLNQMLNNDFSFYAEPGTLYEDGVLYMSLAGANHNNPDGHFSFLMASDDFGDTWRFVNILTDKKDAEENGFDLFTATSLAEENGRVFLLSTPITEDGKEGVHSGTFIFEFDSISKGKLKRNNDGNLIIIKYLKRSIKENLNSGESTYHKFNTYGGIIIPQADLDSAPAIGQIFDTKERIISPSAVEVGSLYISPSSGSIKVGEKMELKAFYQPPMPPCPSNLACYQVMPPPIPVISEWVSSNSNIATVSYKEFNTAIAVVSGVSEGSAEIKAVYKIKESGNNIFTAVAKVSVTSDIQPSITVLSPNGGEGWQVGTNHQIQFKIAENESGYVDLLIFPENNESAYIFNDFFENKKLSAGIYTSNWTIPQNVLTGKYIAKVYLKTLPVEGKVLSTDQSDQPFSIVAASTEEAYFQFSGLPETFIFKLTDPAKIQQARNILSGAEKRVMHVMGLIIKTPVEYNPPWSYHLDPNSITFFENATEVCDASIRYVEEHLSEVGGALLPGNRWCPWNSRLIQEINFEPIPSLTPSITVLSPNGGEGWVGASRQNVKWTSLGIDSTQQVSIWAINKTKGSIYEGNSYNLINTNTTANDGTETTDPAVTHNPPGYSNVIPSGSYVVIIKAVLPDGTIVSDQSDAPFSIVASTTISQTSTLDQMANTLESIRISVDKLFKSLKKR